MRERYRSDQRSLDALSIVGGRPHLLKAESVDRGLRTVGHSHIALRAAIGRLSDYPADGDFNVPLLPGRLTVSDQRALVKPLRDVLIRTRPRVVLLYGDLAVTAAAYAAVASLGLPAVHVEAGYRSGDLSDPEERTRIELDHGVDAHLVYTTAMRDRLLAEDIPNESITLVPDPAQMALLRRLESDPSQGGEPARGLVTFHRTETLNDKHRLTALVAALERVAAAWPLTVVLYAEARYRLLRAGLLDRVCNTTGITTTSTMPLRSYAGLLRDASFVITDSSGVQDDCATLGRVCFVVRRASPRPIAAPLYLVEPASLDPARIEAAQSGGGPRTEQMAADSDADGLLGRGTAEALAIARRRAGRACADAA